MTLDPQSVPPRLTPRSRRQAGFTVVELLAVIGIIVVLIALSIVGYRKLNRSARDNATHTALQSLRAWTTELEATTAHSAGKQGFALLAIPLSAVQPYRSPTTVINWSSVPPPALNAFNINALDALAACGDVNTDSVNPGQANAGRYGYAVQATSIVMGKLMSLPSVKAAIDSMPADRLLKDKTGQIYKYLGPWNTSDGTASGTQVSGGPVLLDGYGNPIIFVPAAGLRNVDRGGQTGTTIDHGNDPAVNRPYRGPIRARDDKPFWASAGSNGKFTGNPSKELNEGDDNVYSFDQ